MRRKRKEPVNASRPSSPWTSAAPKRVPLHEPNNRTAPGTPQWRDFYIMGIGLRRCDKKARAPRCPDVRWLDAVQSESPSRHTAIAELNGTKRPVSAPRGHQALKRRTYLSLHQRLDCRLLAVWHAEPDVDDANSPFAAGRHDDSGNFRRPVALHGRDRVVSGPAAAIPAALVAVGQRGWAHQRHLFRPATLSRCRC
jgi:hypothetical protein